MALSDTSLRNLKPLKAPYKKADSGGLHIVVSPTGTKVWRLSYRFFGKQKTMTIGQYPAVSLVDARAEREAAKVLLAKDIDPGANKKIERKASEVANANTFGAVVEEFMEHMGILKRSDAAIEKNRWMLKVIAAPLTNRPISQITSPEVFELLSSVEKTGRRDTAIATRAAISRVFRRAILSGRADTDPTYALRGALKPPVVVSHPALTDPAQVGGLMRSMAGYTGWVTLKGAIFMQAYGFARPSETRTMNISEIDFDKAIWTIPAAKAKMRRLLDVPLSKQALAVLEGVRPHLAANGDVFPSMMSGKRFLSENSMNSVLRRLGFTGDEHTAHGFRSTASTLLNGSKKFDPDAIEVQLAHLDKNPTRRIYNRWEYWDERVEMMQWWADYLDALALQKP